MSAEPTTIDRTEPMTIDRALGRLAELCRPGVLPCAWATAYHRLLVRDLARLPLADGAYIEYTDEQIRAEFRELLFRCDPDAPVCPCHAGEKAAALAALGQPAAPG